MAVALSSMTAELTAEAGRGGKPTGTASAPDPKARASSPAPGTTGSRWWASTPGPAGTRTRGTGRRGSVTGSGSKPKDTGFTEGNGLTDLKGDMASGSVLAVEQSMKEHGIMGFRTDMELKHMPMEVSLCILQNF